MAPRRWDRGNGVTTVGVTNEPFSSERDMNALISANGHCESALRSLRSSGVDTQTPSKSSPVGVLSPRVFERSSASASTSRGFLVVGTGIAVRRPCLNSAGSMSDVPGPLMRPLSALHGRRFKSRRQFQRRITEPLHGTPANEPVTDSPDGACPDSNPPLEKITGSLLTIR